MSPQQIVNRASGFSSWKCFTNPDDKTASPIRLDVINNMCWLFELIGAMMTQEAFFSTLKNRGFIKISGKESRTFLQGLITNDINLLDQQDCVYACLLSPQGKFLYDFFVTEDNDDILLECEGGERLSSLAKMLTMYKLRADVTIEETDGNTVYGVIGSKQFGYQDPRHVDMGYRSYTRPELPELPFEIWDTARINLTVPDGSRDLIPQKSTMAEGRIDALNGISYDKGCYVGQELTARMHYRGLAKKHLKTITPADIGMKDFPDFESQIEMDGKIVGEMRSSCGDIGIALMKD